MSFVSGSRSLSPPAGGVSSKLEDADIIPLVLTLKELESVMGISLLPKPQTSSSYSPVPSLAPLHEDYPLSGVGSKNFYSKLSSPQSGGGLNRNAAIFRASSTVDSAGGAAGIYTRAVTDQSSSISRMISIDSTVAGGGGMGGIQRASSTASSGIVAQVKSPNLDGVTTTEAGSIMEYVNMDDLNSGKDTRTTFMIRRLPRYLSSDQLESLVQSTGLLDDAYDLLYVPIFTGKAHANRGYAFMNFRTPHLGALFVSIVKFSVDTHLSQQLAKCDIVYAHIQGKDDMVDNLTRVRTGSTPTGGTTEMSMALGFAGSYYAGSMANNLPPGLKLF